MRHSIRSPSRGGSAVEALSACSSEQHAPQRISVERTHWIIRRTAGHFHTTTAHSSQNFDLVSENVLSGRVFPCFRPFIPLLYAISQPFWGNFVAISRPECRFVAVSAVYHEGVKPYSLQRLLRARTIVSLGQMLGTHLIWSILRFSTNTDQIRAGRFAIYRFFVNPIHKHVDIRRFSE